MFPEPAAPAHRRSLLVAALVTTLAIPVLFAIAMGMVDLIIAGHTGGELFFRGLGVVVFVGIPLTAVAVLLLGTPVVLQLRRLGMLNASRVSLIAAIIGAVVMVITFGLFGTWDPLAILMGAVTGAAGGLIFCLAAGIRFRNSTR